MQNSPSPKNSAKTTGPSAGAYWATASPATTPKPVPMARYAPARIARIAKRAKSW